MRAEILNLSLIEFRFVSLVTILISHSFSNFIISPSLLCIVPSNEIFTIALATSISISFPVPSFGDWNGNIRSNRMIQFDSREKSGVWSIKRKGSSKFLNGTFLCIDARQQHKKYWTSVPPLHSLFIAPFPLKLYLTGDERKFAEAQKDAILWKNNQKL